MKKIHIPPSWVSVSMGTKDEQGHSPLSPPVFGHRLIWWAVVVGVLTWFACTRVASGGC